MFLCPAHIVCAGILGHSLSLVQSNLSPLHQVADAVKRRAVLLTHRLGIQWLLACCGEGSSAPQLFLQLKEYVCPLRS